MLSRGLATKLLRTRLLMERQLLHYGAYCARIPTPNVCARGNLVLFMKRHHASKNSKIMDDKLNSNAKASTKADSVRKITEELKGEINNNENELRKENETMKLSKIKDATIEVEASASKNKSSPVTSTKTIEIQTSKGILSVTTTIEDSKINDVILEKTSSVSSSPNVQAEKNENTSKMRNNNNKKINTDKDDKEQVQNLTKTAKESMKKVVAAFIKPDTMGKVIQDKMDGVKTAPMSNEIHLTEKKTIKNPVKLTVKGIEKLAAAATAAVANAANSTTKTTTTTSTTVEAAQPKVMESSAPQRPPKPARVLVDFNRSSLERNFITPGRAMSDFLLKATDLEDLPKIKRRSPYEQEPPMTVFWRRDVESKAIQVWGSRENLLKEQLKRDVERKKHQQNIFTVKRRLRDYRREIGHRTYMLKDNEGLSGESGKVVLIAVGINGVNFLFKVIGWLYTGSHSMFAECIHSLADTINQLILVYGIHKSQQHADPDHPYGYSNWKYVSSLISGVGIFCVGTGLSIYHGITGLMNPTPLDDLFWALLILGGSFVSEGATLIVAMNEVRRSAAIKKISFKEYGNF